MSPAEGFRSVGEDHVYDGYAISVVRGHFEAPDGSAFTRDIIRHPGAVGVVPLHDDGTVTLVRQFRAPIGATMLEIPAGLRDVSDEPPAVTAARELAEEVGLEAQHLERLVGFHVAAGHTDEFVEVFVATGLRTVPLDLQGPEEEAMSIERHPLADLPAMIADGRITDAKTLIAIALLANR